GHWKRINTTGVKNITPFDSWDYLKAPGFFESRDKVMSHCIEVGINYVDAMAAVEVVAYGQLLKGRRDKFYLGYGWWAREPRIPEYRDPKRLMQAFDENLKQAGLDYVNVWQFPCPMKEAPNWGGFQGVKNPPTKGRTRARRRAKRDSRA